MNHCESYENCDLFEKKNAFKTHKNNKEGLVFMTSQMTSRLPCRQLLDFVYLLTK